MEWSNPIKQDPNSEPIEEVGEENKSEAGEEVMESHDLYPKGAYPSPRANTAAAYLDGMVYIFGGHGGQGYQRVAFNDLWRLDLSTGYWTRCKGVNNPCEPRGGHSLFALGKKLYIFGGWNLETQYNDIATFDIETKEWGDPEIYGDIPRWNFSAVMVEAIPSWKYFIFGGEQGNFPEGGPRKFGTFVNSSCVLDIETMSWMVIKTEDDDGETAGYYPPEREYSSMIYDTKNYRLVIFGGWANEWLNDVHALNVSSIVGPPYAITEIIPNLGQLTGGTNIIVKGVGFKDTSDIRIRFAVGKQSAEVSGTYVSENELSCITPSFEHIGPKECEVRMNIQGGDYTNTYCNFSFFMNTREYKCLAYGPGLLEGGACGHETEFIIQARNDHDENRKSGRDHFEVKVTIEGEKPQQIDAELIDNDDGTYLVKYKVDET
jgi:dynein heavy chain, axonemal